MKRTTHQELLEVIAYLEWSIDWKAKEIKIAAVEAEGLNYDVLTKRMKEQQAELQQKQGIIEAYADFKNKLVGIDAGIFEKHYIDGKILADVAKELGRTPGHIRQRHTALRKRIRMYKALQGKGLV